MYNQVVLWKPLFITLPKTKTGHKFVESMDRVLAAIAEKQSIENLALYAAMLMPHLVLAKTTSGPDASRNKTTTSRLRMWLNGEIEERFKKQKHCRNEQRNQNPTIEQDICYETSMHTYPLGNSQMLYRVLTTVKRRSIIAKLTTRRFSIF